MDRLLTFITFTTAPLDDSEPLTDKAMRTIETVQGQPDPETWDLHIVQDVGDFTMKELRRMGAEQSNTEWISFIREGEEVHPDAVKQALRYLPESTAYAVSGAGGMLWWRRAYWLEEMAS